MELPIDPELINKYVADQIIKSSIGIELDKVIQKTIKDITTSYNNPYETVIKTHINQAIFKYVQDTYRLQIEEAVKTVIAKNLPETLLQRAMDKFVQNIQIER